MPITGSLDPDVDPISIKDCYIEIDLGADDSWEPLWSWASGIAQTGEEVPTTETYPFGHSAIVFAGRPSPGTVTVTSIYTESSTQPFHNIRAYFEANPGGPCNVRWAPAGSAPGNKLNTTVGGKLTSCPPPTGEGDATTATVFAFTVQAGSIDASGYLGS